MAQNLSFTKATACGNDFILIDGASVPPGDRHRVTKQICDRHLGVGADGVEWLCASKDVDLEARLINSDGSDAEVSGNGTRCVAAFYAQQHGSKIVRILTGAGVKTCTLTQQHGMEFEFRSEMGEPHIDGELTLQTSGGERKGIKLSMGNPQFIVFVDEFPPNWQKQGTELEGHKAFPNRTNVEFVRVTGPNVLEIRIFERGAGETQSSGTGSCASAVAAIHTGRVKSPVRVVSPGGAQIVEWSEGGTVALTGPARILCQGDFYL